jgi:hypothetical protein
VDVLGEAMCLLEFLDDVEEFGRVAHGEFLSLCYVCIIVSGW